METKNSSAVHWLPTDEACQHLGLPSEKSLWTLKAAGILRPGVHFIVVGTRRSAPHRWDVDACIEALRSNTRRVYEQNPAAGVETYKEPNNSDQR